MKIREFGPDREAEIVDIIVDWMAPVEELAWSGYPEFDREQAVELLDWLLDHGVEIK